MHDSPTAAVAPRADQRTPIHAVPPAPWAVDLAIDIIADAHRWRYEDALRLIATRLEIVRELGIAAGFAQAREVFRP